MTSKLSTKSEAKIKFSNHLERTCLPVTKGDGVDLVKTHLNDERVRVNTSISDIGQRKVTVFYKSLFGGKDNYCHSAKVLTWAEMSREANKDEKIKHAGFLMHEALADHPDQYELLAVTINFSKKESELFKLIADRPKNGNDTAAVIYNRKLAKVLKNHGVELYMIGYDLQPTKDQLVHIHAAILFPKDAARQIKCINALTNAIGTDVEKMRVHIQECYFAAGFILYAINSAIYDKRHLKSFHKMENLGTPFKISRSLNNATKDHVEGLIDELRKIDSK